MVTATPTLVANRMDAWPPAATILDILAERVSDGGGRVALRARDERNVWRPTTWARYGRAIAEVAAGLDALGVGAGDRVGILSWNRPEWQEADLGILAVRGVSVPVYPTSAAGQVAYVLDHSGAKVCFVEDSEQLARVLESRDQLTGLAHVVVFDNGVPLDDPMVLSFEELRAVGAQQLERDPGLVDRIRPTVVPDDVRDPRVHERDDRTAQGRDPHAREHHGDVAVGDDARVALARRSIPLLPSAQPHHGTVRVALRAHRRPAVRRGSPARSRPSRTISPTAGPPSSSPCRACGRRSAKESLGGSSASGASPDSRRAATCRSRCTRA